MRSFNTKFRRKPQDRAEQSGTMQNKTEQGGTGQGGTGQGGTEQGGTEQGGTEQGGTEQGGTEQGGTEQGGTGQGGTGQEGTGQEGTEQGGTEQGGAEQAELWRFWAVFRHSLGQKWPFRAFSGIAVPIFREKQQQLCNRNNGVARTFSLVASLDRWRQGKEAHKDSAKGESAERRRTRETGHGKLEHVRAGNERLGHGRLGHGRLEHVRVGTERLGHERLRHERGCRYAENIVYLRVGSPLVG